MHKEPGKERSRFADGAPQCGDMTTSSEEQLGELGSMPKHTFVLDLAIAVRVDLRHDLFQEIVGIFESCMRRKGTVSSAVHSQAETRVQFMQGGCLR